MHVTTDVLANVVIHFPVRIDGLADIDELTPQTVRPGDRHTYWILGFSLDTEQLGCSADAFADAVRHEGVPLIKGREQRGCAASVDRTAAHGRGRHWHPGRRPREPGGGP